MKSTIADQIAELEKTLKGADHEDEDTKKAVRLAMVKHAATDMSPDEKKEARKAFDEEDKEKKSKKSADDEDDDNDKPKTGKKAKKSMDEEHEDDKTKEAKKSAEDYKEIKKAMEEKDTQIASLVANQNYLMAKPLMDKMLSARKAAGATPEVLQNFTKSLYGKSLKEIQAKHEDDQLLLANSNLTASHITASDDDDIPFNGQNTNDGTSSILVGKDGAEKSLEELFS